MAGFGAFFAMLHGVLCALVTAGLADVGAHAANGFCMSAAPSHRTDGGRTDRGTVHVKGDALRHRLDVLLLQTRGCTVIACDIAGIASFDARIELLVRHLIFPLVT